MRVPRRSSRAPGERGAVLLLVALVLTALMLIVALVIDYGFVRQTRQSGKLTADAAVSAGSLALASDGYSRPWRGACAALDYLQANEDDPLQVTFYDGLSDAPLDVDPCTAASGRLSLQCSASGANWARIVASDGDDFSAEIRSPYVTPDSGFPEDTAVYAGDNGRAGFNGCDQLAVIILDDDSAFFGGIAGRTSYETATRSVGRVDIGGGEGTPAFLLLERVACGVLENQADTSTTLDAAGQPQVLAGIIVEPASATEPGGIHVDSTATAGCSGNGAGGYTVYSGEIGSAPRSAGIRILGPGGKLSLVALSPIGNSDRAVATSTGVTPTGSEGSIVSRKPIDDRYSTGGVRNVKGLHALAKRKLALAAPDYTDTATDPPTVYTPVTTCSGHVGEVAATHVYVDCPGGYTADSATFPNAVDIVFNGPVQVPTGKALSLPAAADITIAGVVSNGDPGIGITVQGGSPGGRLGVNANPFTTTAESTRAACTGRSATPTRMVIFGGRTNGSRGALDVAGYAALCHTFVYLAGPKDAAEFTARERVDGTPHVTCTTNTPCPADNVLPSAYLTIAGFVKWSGPSVYATEPPAGGAGFEDLALWTESSETSSVSGALDATGVYFLPNSRFIMQSPSDFSPRDAQFIARSLRLLQGLLRMKPTPENSVQAPFLAGVSLVR